MLRQAMKVWDAAHERDDWIGDKALTDIQQIDDGTQSVSRAYKNLQNRIDQEKNNAVDWDTAQTALQSLEITKRTATFEDLRSQLATVTDWEDSLDSLMEKHESMWYRPGQAEAFVFTYLLEKEGFSTLSEDETPDSITARMPEKEELNHLYWEQGQDLVKIAVRFGVHSALVEHWMCEYDIPSKLDGFTEIQQNAIDDVRGKSQLELEERRMSSEVSEPTTISGADGE